MTSLEVSRSARPALRGLLAAVVVAAAAALPAQEITGSVSGTIKDESGAVLPGTTITVRGGRLPADGQSAVSNASGGYRVALLPPGSYTLEEGGPRGIRR